MADTIHLDVVTPEQRLVATEVGELTAPAFEGEVGILPGHANYIAILKCGGLEFLEDGKKHHLAIGGGFIEVTLEDGIRIMAESAEFADEIDLERAQKAKERAERRIKDFDPEKQDIDLVRAEAALKRALNRIDVAKKAGN